MSINAKFIGTIFWFRFLFESKLFDFEIKSIPNGLKDETLEFWELESSVIDFFILENTPPKILFDPVPIIVLWDCYYYIF